MAVRLKYFLGLAVLSVVACGGFGQRRELVDVPWAPPADLDFPSGPAPTPTVTQPLVTALRLGTMSIRLERTELSAVREEMGGEEGQRGDAGTRLRWLCYAGQDTAGRWTVWLSSGEIDGPSIGSFEWRRVDANAHFDPRCVQLPAGASVTLSPTPLRLGISESEVLHRLGRPTVHRGEILDYEYSEQEKTYDVWNTLAVRLRNGMVDSILGAETMTT
jgi:hypothetical protein